MYKKAYQVYEIYVGGLLRGRTQESVLSTKFIWSFNSTLPSKNDAKVQRIRVPNNLPWLVKI